MGTNAAEDQRGKTKKQPFVAVKKLDVVMLNPMVIRNWKQTIGQAILCVSIFSNDDGSWTKKWQAAMMFFLSPWHAWRLTAVAKATRTEY